MEPAVNYDVHDARKRLRLRCTAQVSIETRDRRSAVGRLRDIGLESLYVFTTEEDGDFFIHGEPVRIRVILSWDGSDLSIDTNATIVRLDDDGLAVRFLKPLKWWPIFVIFPETERT